jgi:hypothetical protein
MFYFEAEGGVRVLISLSEAEIEMLIDSLRDTWVNSKKYSSNTNAFEGVKRVNDNYMFCCPVHKESRPSCGVAIEYPHAWHCFSCDAGGSAITSLVNTVVDGSIVHAEYFIEKLLYADKGIQKPLSISTLGDVLNRTKNKKTPSSISEEEGLKYKGIIHPYLYKRGFSNKAINAYELGYDKNTDSIVFPVRDHKGDIRFLQRRSVNTKHFHNDEGVDKRDILYGLYYLLKSGRKYNEICIVESATDVVSCYMGGLPAIGLMGRVFYKAMLPVLCLLKVNNIRLMLDNDTAGDDATAITEQYLRKHGFNVQTVVHIENHKDANDLLLGHRLHDVSFIHSILRKKEYSNE